MSIGNMLWVSINDREGSRIALYKGICALLLLVDREREGVVYMEYGNQA